MDSGREITTLMKNRQRRNINNGEGVTGGEWAEEEGGDDSLGETSSCVVQTLESRRFLAAAGSCLAGESNKQEIWKLPADLIWRCKSKKSVTEVPVSGFLPAWAATRGEQHVTSDNLFSCDVRFSFTESQQTPHVDGKQGLNIRCVCFISFYISHTAFTGINELFRKMKLHLPAELKGKLHAFLCCCCQRWAKTFKKSKQSSESEK